MALSLAEDLATYLEGQSIGLNYNGAGTINCFVSLLPDQPDLAAAIIERGGLPPVMWLTGGGVYESHIDNPTVMVRVRASMGSYNDGHTLIQNIYKALHGVTETTLNAGGALFHLIAAMQYPTYLGRDERQRHEWSQNYRVIYENPNR